MELDITSCNALRPCVGGWFPPRAGGRGYSIYLWVGRCGPASHTLTLFKTKIADFPTYDRIPIFDTLLKAFNPKPYSV